MITSPFIPIQETQLPDGRVVAAFSVSKFLARQSGSGDLRLLSDFDTSAPWTDISYLRALALSRRNSYNLLADTQYLAITQQILQNAKNWESGQIGVGELVGAGDETSATGNLDILRIRRYFVGEYILEDFGPGYFTLLFDDVQGDADGVIQHSFTDQSSSVSEFGRGFDEVQGIPYPTPGINWAGNVIVRSGVQASPGSGTQMRMQHIWPEGSSPIIGYRVVKPEAEIDRHGLKLVGQK
jgi:hypothetical protein